jgi:hypothetical protein
VATYFMAKLTLRERDLHVVVVYKDPRV